MACPCPSFPAVTLECGCRRSRARGSSTPVPSSRRRGLAGPGRARSEKHHGEHAENRSFLPGCRGRYRCRRCAGRAHQAAGGAHAPSGPALGHWRFRGALPGAGRLPRTGSGLGYRRRRHQAETGLCAGRARHHRHRPGGHERQRHPGAGGRAALLPGLFRLWASGRGHGGSRGGRHCPGLRAVRLRAAGRRDGRDAGHVSGRRV